MNAACLILLSVMPVTGGVPEMVKVPTQRNLITRVERYVERVNEMGTINSKVHFKALQGQRPTPVFVFETPDQIARMRCRPVYGE